MMRYWKKKLKWLWRRANNVFQTDNELNVENHNKHTFKIKGGTCWSCARDGHGRYHPECFEDCKEWEKHGEKSCWRPRGVIYVYGKEERVV